MNTLVLRIKSLKDFFEKSNKIREVLLQELIDNATDAVIVKRRIRMLNDLSKYESMIISKIAKFESNNIEDWRFTEHDHGEFGLSDISNRSS